MLSILMLTSLLLTLCACGERCEVCGKPANNHQCLSAETTDAVGTVAGPAQANTEIALATGAGVIIDPQPQDKPGNIQLTYAGNGLACAANLFPCGYSWETDLGNGQMRMTHADAEPPYAYRGTIHIKMSAVEGYVIGVRLPAGVTSYTLTAHPVGSDYTAPGQELTLDGDSKLHLLKGSYYYHFEVTFENGNAVYGFFID